MVKNAIKVYARLKPEKNRSRITNYEIQRRPEKHLDQDILKLSAPHKNHEYIDHRPESWNFSFYKIFEEDTSQESIFQDVAQPVIQSVLDGYNGTIFAYGQTGSGKTYSITGKLEIDVDQGIIPRTLGYIFDGIEKHPENVYSVEVAYLEIYNENGYDLLDRKQQHECPVTRLEDLPRVTIQEDEAGKLHMKNLTFHCVNDESEAFELLTIGNSNRATSETPMNPSSSRSHCIFTIVISTKQFQESRYKRTKIHMVDLAGSERVYKCAISGTILTEAKHINLSLHYLEQVIVCLGQENVGHIPYRNSLLTAILRDSLGGNCLTTMLATLNVASLNLEESVSTCRFAQRVALIRNDVNLIVESDIQCENRLLKLENERLRKQIEILSNYSNHTVQNNKELNYEEREELNIQIKKFLKSNKEILWDFDPRKIKFCLEKLKENINAMCKKKICLKSSFSQTEKIKCLEAKSALVGSSAEEFRPASDSNASIKLQSNKINNNDNISKRSKKSCNDTIQVVKTPHERDCFKIEVHNFPSTVIDGARDNQSSKTENTKPVRKKKLQTIEKPDIIAKSQSVDINEYDSFPIKLKSQTKSINLNDMLENSAKPLVDNSIQDILKLNNDIKVDNLLKKKLSPNQTNAYVDQIQLTPTTDLRESLQYMEYPDFLTDTSNRFSEEYDKITEDIVDAEVITDNDQEFINSLPLTGDPEIDDEIIAFYKAKRSGSLY
ncbi:kinesin-like protein KIF6 [Prorops nasuta]|uniref:kinesin-like protein KIF6 n=1 Tax=Prorops nasuta TaxID=863751 RepID=UPI0034CFB5CD